MWNIWPDRDDSYPDDEFDIDNPEVVRACKTIFQHEQKKW